jgi:hypothetical protein
MPWGLWNSKPAAAERMIDLNRVRDCTQGYEIIGGMVQGSEYGWLVSLVIKPYQRPIVLTPAASPESCFLQFVETLFDSEVKLLDNSCLYTCCMAVSCRNWAYEVIQPIGI